MSDERLGPGTYMTPEEAKEFHTLFTMSMGIFTLIAIAAHILVWFWRPWLGASLPLRSAHLESATHFVQVAMSTLFA
jgi:light-harvesting complex 1 beta chain